jgi:hypothetical protein
VLRTMSVIHARMRQHQNGVVIREDQFPKPSSILPRRPPFGDGRDTTKLRDCRQRLSVMPVQLLTVSFANRTTSRARTPSPALCSAGYAHRCCNRDSCGLPSDHSVQPNKNRSTP